MNEEDVARVLRDLPLSLGADGLVVLESAQSRQAIFAGRSLMRLFGASCLEDLSDRLFSADDPGARRLAHLARALPIDGGPSVERLRFVLPPATRSVTLICRRMSREDGSTLFAAAALDLLDRPDDAAREDFRIGAEAGARTLSQAGEDGDQRPSANKGDISAVRFVWRTDAEDRIVAVTPQLGEVVGATAGNLVGQNWVDLVRGLDARQGPRVADLMARREPWSGVEVLWPIDGADAAVRISFGAAPTYDRDRCFVGYRGFGVIHIDRTQLDQSSRSGARPSERVREQAQDPVSVPASPIVKERRPAFPTAEAINVIPLRPSPASDEAAKSASSPMRAATGGRRGPDLTSDERDAFDAIASMLGSRLAAAARETSGSGDSPAEAVPHGIDAARTRLGLAAAQKPDAKTPQSGGGQAAWFDQLSMGVLICRDEAPVFANRFLLNLVGCASLEAALEARVFASVARLDANSDGELVELRGPAGGNAAMRARREAIEWDGREAELVSLLPSPVADIDGERRRYKSEARELSAILDTVMDGVLTFDSQGRILALNRSGEALFGYDEADIIGQPFMTLIAPESRACVDDYFEGVKSGGVASLLNDGREVMGLARRGGVIPIFMTLGRISIGAAPGGGARDLETRFCALLRDVTHWKKVERELDEARKEAERASALKSEFLARVSHEIRTPLNAIIGFAEVIMDERFGPVGNERYKEYLKDIHNSGALVMSLVNDLLDLSKIEAGKMDLDFREVDANRIISQCVSIMQPQASRARVVIRLSLAPGLPHLFADERSLRQIVLNLLSNAVKFNQPGGQVIVTTALSDAGHVSLRVRDTGVGMSEADIEIALEPFRQLAVSRPTGGTGLGLPLTKALVEANRAFFSIKSKKDEGTLVEIAFPSARVLAN